MAVPVLRVIEGQARSYRRTWKGTVVTTFLNPVLYLVAMGMALGTLVDRGPGGTALPGGTYLEFLAPGLLAGTAMYTGAFDSSWPVMAAMKWLKTYHAALATPITHRDLVYGHLSWVALRLTLTAGVFAAVMAVVGAAPPARAALAVPPAVVTGVAFAALVAAFAARLQNDAGLSAMFRFGIVPMFLFSGTFFPISQLPAALQPVALLTPLWHGVQLTRAAALGIPTAWPPALHVAYLLGLVALGAALMVKAYRRRLVL